MVFISKSDGSLEVVDGQQRLIALPVVPRLTLPVTLGFTLMCGGGIGNVIDFLNIGIGPLRTGIFNVADVAIMTGAILVLVSAIARKRILSRTF